MLKKTYSQLEKSIGYRFSRSERIQSALTHPSFRHENEATPDDNQRLEFLGDAVLGLAVAAHLYETRPDLNEGEMTKLRSRLTSTRALAVVAAGIGLGHHLRLGRGEIASGGHLRDSILADALEAVIGAAYLDGSMKAVQKVFQKLIVPRLDENLTSAWVDNPKGSLQEWAQQNAQTNPRYNVISQRGPPHAMVFIVEALVGGNIVGRGEGTSKQAAEIAAAANAMQNTDRLADSAAAPCDT
jgi:ribonuclease-3